MPIKPKFIKKKRFSTKKIKNKPIKKRRKKTKKSLVLIQLLFSFFILLLTILIFYTFFIFPETLNKNIKKDLIEMYKPVIFDDSKNIFVLKINEKPAIELQQEVFNIIQQKYGLETKFEKINNNYESGINKITFYKNNNKFNDLKPIYIFWGENLIIPEKEEISKKELNYEKIEEKRKNEKQEDLIKPDIKQFKHGTYEKERFVTEKSKIAVVIDDVGYSYNSTYDFLSLGFPITFALIPEMKDSDKFYRLFRKQEEK